MEAGNGTGKLTITLAFKKEKRMVSSKPTVKATVPVGAVDASMFFVTSEGNLSDVDPKQTTIEFRSPQKLVSVDGGGSSSKTPATPADGNDPKKGH